MTKPINTEGIEKATSKNWQEWLKILDDMGAKDLTHKEIAVKVKDKLLALRQAQGHSTGNNKQLKSSKNSEVGLPRASVEWWAQGITVAYEQHIGRRVPGQRTDGSFEVSVSKTFNGSMDEAFAAWLELTNQQTNFNGIGIVGEPGSSETEKWRNWRCNLEDGTKIVIGINQKTPDKAGLGLAHQKLASSEDAETWRSYWQEFLSHLRSKN